MVEILNLRRNAVKPQRVLFLPEQGAPKVHLLGSNRLSLMLPLGFGQLAAAALRPMRFPGQLALGKKTPVSTSTPTARRVSIERFPTKPSRPKA